MRVRVDGSNEAVEKSLSSPAFCGEPTGVARPQPKGIEEPEWRASRTFRCRIHDCIRLSDARPIVQFPCFPGESIYDVLGSVEFIEDVFLNVEQKAKAYLAEIDLHTPLDVNSAGKWATIKVEQQANVPN